MNNTLTNSILAENYRRREYEIPDDLDGRRLIQISPLNEREAEMMQQMEELRQACDELRRDNYTLRARVAELERQARAPKPAEAPKVHREVMQPAQIKETTPVQGAPKPRGGISL